MPYKRNRKSKYLLLSPALRKLLLAEIDYNADPAALPMWRRYLADRSQVNFNCLFEHYLPIARMMAGRLKTRSQLFLTEDLDSMLSDGFMSLTYAIRSAKIVHPDYGIMFCNYVRRAMIQGVMFRRWGGVTRNCRQNVVESIRARLTGELGRVPEKKEIARDLRATFTNPRLYIAGIDDTVSRMVPMSQLESGEGKARTYRDPSISSPLSGLIGDEAMRIVTRSLSPVDRRIFKMLMKGEKQAEIARVIGVTRQRIEQRLNGVLWLARCNASLASALGVEPDAAPPKYRKRFSFNPTPARLVG